MKIRKMEIITLAILLLSFAVGIYFYPQLPERVASHWNARGMADGYMPKFWGLFLTPLIAVGLWLLLVLIPRIDPLKANIDKFRKHYDGFVLLMVLYMLYLYGLIILWNMGVSFSMTQLLAPAFGVLFYGCGALIQNAKRNWFVGIRTPWTMSSEKVWDKTHLIGGRLFKVAGVVSFLGVFFPDYAIYLVLITALLVAFGTVIYSYFEYQKEVSHRD